MQESLQTRKGARLRCTLVDKSVVYPSQLLRAPRTPPRARTMHARTLLKPPCPSSVFVFWKRRRTRVAACCGQICSNVRAPGGACWRQCLKPPPEYLWCNCPRGQTAPTSPLQVGGEHAPQTRGALVSQECRVYECVRACVRACSGS